MKNVIILTTGRTGSSILAGLISKERFYVDLESVQPRLNYPKGDFENPELIRLNKKLLEIAGYSYTKRMNSKNTPLHSIIKSFTNCTDSELLDECATFIERCSNFEPWLWKDPRLVFTIHFWKKFIDFNKINFITITRDPYQIFRSYSKDGIIYTKKEVYERIYHQNGLITKFLNSNALKYLKIDYSELWDQKLLNCKLNDFLKIRISEQNYNAIVKPTNKQQESEFAFKLRYYQGYLKLLLKRQLFNESKI